MNLKKEQVEFFYNNGYLVVEDFMSSEEVKTLMDRMEYLLKDFDPKATHTIFTTDNEKHTKNDYFVDSSDKISFFLEEKAYNPEKNEFISKKSEILNKVGHALHDKDEVFKKFSFQKKIKNYCHDLGLKKPSICQSMYIYKPPKIGGEVTAHQDSTFLFTEGEEDPCVGFWFALQDAKKENACLWAIPGSHKKGLWRRWEKVNDEMEFRDINPDLKYDTDIHDKDYVPVEMKSGSVILIHGHLIHKSHKNLSDKPRDAFALHIIEDQSKWSKLNWLQRETFPDLWEE
eukprot:gene10327-2743_t